MLPLQHEDDRARPGSGAADGGPCSRPSSSASATALTDPGAAAVATTDSEPDLHLEGALNGRELGGITGRHGPIPPHRLLRTADLSKATPADRDILAKHDVKLDLDLRTRQEVGARPDTLARDPRFQYANISLFGESPLDLDHVTSLGDVYIAALAQNQPQFRDVFARLAAQSDGAVLIHCTAGKDRTGMVVAILLDLAGVDRPTIVANYASSAKNIESVARPRIEKDPKLAVLLGSPPADMERFLDALDLQYGGARSYLHTIGLCDAEIASLEARMGQ